MPHATSAPARPRLVVRVGVTGHRRLDRMDRDQLVARVGAVLDAVAAAVRSVQRDRAHDFSGAPEIRVLSPLAEGADQIVAGVTRTRGLALDCPLPFPRDEYARDFADEPARRRFETLLSEAEAVFELDGRRFDEGAAYAAVGRLVIERCDVLIAIWDGATERGVGGTAQIAREAVASGRIVVWIGAEAPHAVTLLPAPDAGEGEPLAVLASRLDLALKEHRP